MARASSATCLTFRGWRINGGPSTGAQPEARFRPKHTVMKDEGPWSWHANPFIGTTSYNGLRVLMLILNESDLKDSNTAFGTFGTKLAALQGAADALTTVDGVLAGIRMAAIRGDRSGHRQRRPAPSGTIVV